MNKAELRIELRARRREHVAALPDATRGLLFSRPPAALAALVPSGTVIGVYLPQRDEAPVDRYARWFAEQGHDVALPWFANRAAPMEFRAWANPWEAPTANGPFGLQPDAAAPAFVPDVLFAPLLGFTAAGDRLGQGGGHYDRWLAAHPTVTAIGLAWDCQLVDALPTEQHDAPLNAIVTPTRIYRG